MVEALVTRLQDIGLTVEFKEPYTRNDGDIWHVVCIGEPETKRTWTWPAATIEEALALAITSVIQAYRTD